jgi:hypothetical protein
VDQKGKRKKEKGKRKKEKGKRKKEKGKRKKENSTTACKMTEYVANALFGVIMRSDYTQICSTIWIVGV